ncbi:MAG: murein biosynthesis integral membrane protein MurJ [Gammaproteobacteria bacterium]|nr:murein biosynthesis integral membrane protein MurJ [Gammaproteobacteria bacterium]
MTLLSRVLGLARDIVIARFFASGFEADAFFVAFKIPNFMRRLFAEGAFSQAFVPVLTEYKNTRAKEDTKAFISAVAGTLGAILFIVAIVGSLASPLLVMVFAAGFYDEPEKFNLTADLLRLTFPYIFLISMTALAGGILNAWKKFAIPAVTPVLLNVSLIGCVFYLSPYLDVPVHSLAWGVLLAGCLQLFFQLPFLYSLGLLPKPRWGWKDKGVKKVVKLMVPIIFGSSVAQINLLFDTFIASFLVTGSVAWLYYADRLLEFPLGIFGIALATVVLPYLSESHVKKQSSDFTQTLAWAVHIAMLIALPAMVGLFLLASPILATLFQYEAFTQNDTFMSGLSLMAYSLGLPAFIGIKILVNGFYARQDTKTPVKIGIIALVFNMFLNVVFVYSMIKIDYIAPHVGLALATVGSAYLNAGLLAYHLHKQKVLTIKWSMLFPFIRILLAVSAMAVVVFVNLPEQSIWTAWEWQQRVLRLGLLITAAIGSYLFVLWFFGLRKGDLAVKNT